MAYDAVKLYNEALSLGLDIRSDVPADELYRIYNGVGASWMKEEWRRCLDGMFEEILPAVEGHDIDFAYGDGTYGDFLAANERLEKNGRICADAKFPWWRPKRYIVRRKARLCRKVCDAFGWSAYLAAVEETKQHNNSKKQGGRKWNTATEHQRLVRGKARERAQSLLSMLLMNPEA